MFNADGGVSVSVREKTKNAETRRDDLSVHDGKNVDISASLQSDPAASADPVLAALNPGVRMDATVEVGQKAGFIGRTVEVTSATVNDKVLGVTEGQGNETKLIEQRIQAATKCGLLTP